MSENQDQENTPYTPPWRPALQEPPNQPEPTNESTRLKILNKKLVVLIIVIVVVLLGALTTVLATGSLSLKGIKETEKIKEALPFIQDRKYETSFYEVSLPKDWSVSTVDTTITASDPKRPIREAIISSTEYNQKLINDYKESPTNAPVKDSHVYHARWLIGECCVVDKTFGEYSQRVYYLWNEEEKMMAKVKIRWEPEPMAIETQSELKRWQAEGRRADPSIESVEKKIFGSFRFKDLTEN